MPNPFAAHDIFAALKRLYRAYEGHCIVRHDAPGMYFLATHEVRARDGYRTAFGGVVIERSYVSAHLMPVYVHPELLVGLPERLEQRRQGKSCFDFTKLDPELVSELETLVKVSFQRFEMDGRFRRAARL